MYNDPSRFSSVIALLQGQAAAQPEHTAFVFLEDGEAEGGRISYRELDLRARQLAAQLLELGQKGERVVIMYPSGIEYLVAFFGCLYAGLVAVPVALPRRNRSVERLRGVVADSGARLAFAPAQVQANLGRWFPEDTVLNGLVWVEVPVDVVAGGRLLEGDSVGPDDLAFLQYTSGSSGIPKGVMVSHGNLLHNAAMAATAFGHTSETIFVGWLPLYHDMGLIGNVLQPLFLGVTSIFMAPNAFLQKPVRWLNAITRYKGTTSGAPNFAYDLCVERISEGDLQALDLRSWKVAFNGAEPVRAGTLSRFAARFAPCGFVADSYYPCYGMAEATLFITGGESSLAPKVGHFSAEALRRNRGVPVSEGEGVALVSNGHAWLGLVLKIVDPQTLVELKEGEVGEVWIHSPSNAHGYWNRPELSAEVFGAHLNGETGPDYLRTGDLGFVDGAELYLTGRHKDLIVIRGSNHYPQDIEETVAGAHDAVALAGVLAVSVEVKGVEQLVLGVEIGRTWIQGLEATPIYQAIRAAVAEVHQLHVYDVVLLREGGLPKTTSGKVMRRPFGLSYQAGELEMLEHHCVPQVSSTGEVADWVKDRSSYSEAEQRAQLKTYLLESLAGSLGISAQAIDMGANLAALGVDSLQVITLQHRIKADLDVQVGAEDLWGYQNLQELLEGLWGGLQEAKAELAAPVAGLASIFPLSKNQETIYLTQQVAPQSAVFHLHCALRWELAPDMDKLARAVERLVQRHAQLRTRFFVSADGELMQETLVEGRSALVHRTLVGISSERFVAELETELRAPLDLEQGEVCRFVYLEVPGQEQVLLIVVHHIVADLWSFERLLQDLGALYEAPQAGAFSLSSPYGAFAQAQRAWRESEAAQVQRAYWLDCLKGELPILDLPTDLPRPSRQTFAGASVHARLSGDLLARARALAKAEGTTLFSVLMSAWALLLHRYTRQDELLIGYPAAEREHEAFENTLGNFVNTLVHRSAVVEGRLFPEFLGATHRQIRSAQQNRQYPFTDLVSQLGVARERSRATLVQTWFVLQQLTVLKGTGAAALQHEGGTIQFGELQARSQHLEQGCSQFDLSLFAVEAGDHLALSLNYSTDLFLPATVTRMLTHFEVLLSEIVKAPQAAVAQYAYLDSEEYTLVTEGFNATQVDYEKGVCLHQLFERQVDLSPTAIALQYEEKAYTYREVNALANVLARRLKERGIGPNCLVGVLMERSAEMVIALYAILKAGGAYVPLDPEYPVERLGLLVKDMDNALVLTQHALLPKLGDLEAEMVAFSVAELQTTALGGEGINLVSEGSSEDLAYMIYTSGSTGMPKGVLIRHSGIVNRLQWMQAEYGLTAQDAVLQKTPYSFDVSVWEFFWPLLNGARLVVARPDGHRDPLYLRDVIVREEITTVHFVPSMLGVFLEGEDLQECQSLRRVICSGEALSASLRDRFYTIFQCPLYNLYGPTEASVDVTAYTCDKQQGSALVPIGKPIANTQIYILDGAGRPTGIGVAGELHIGGIQLAKGYHARPELTAKHFVTNPLPKAGGAVLYKSGDLARWLPDGNIEFLGRLDFQVKVNGFRIELGEIEAVLGRHPHVKAAVVLAQKTTQGLQRLVAYVIPEAGKVLEEQALKSFLERQLPKHFVPAVFVPLTTFPMTVSGKLDRKALPQPEMDAREIEYVGPRTLEEEVLAEVWAKVLRLERVGVRQNFFEAGGDSLRAIQIKSQAQLRGINFTIHQLLQHQTIEQLCLHLDDAEVARDSVPDLAPFALISEEDRKKVPEGVVDALPLSALQAGLVFITESNPESAFYHDIFMYRMKAPFDFAAMDKAVQLVSRNHPILRTAFVINGFKEPLQFVYESVRVPVFMEDFRGHGEHVQQAIDAWTAAEKKNYFDWKRAPLIRFNLHRITDETFNYVLSFHDSILDGWSVANMNTEVFSYYFAILAGEEPVLRTPPQYSYRHFVAMEHRTRATAASEQYWRGTLSDKPFTVIPRWPRPASVDGLSRSHDHNIFFEEDLFKAMLAFARKNGFPLKSVLMAAHFRVMHYLTQETDMISGLLANGRLEEPDGDRTLGMHLNTVPFRMRLPEGSWKDFVRHVFETERAMLPHRRFPLPKLQDRGNAPLFEFAFNFIHFHVYENFPFFKEMFQHGSFIDPLHYPMTANFRRFPFGSRLLLSLNFNDGEMSAAQVKEIGKYYINCFHDIVSNPDAWYLGADLMTAEERKLQLETWNATAHDYSDRGRHCLHTQIEAQVAAAPEHAAVIFGSEVLSYRALDAAANRLAHQILQTCPGIKLVGVCMERSLDLVVGMLAILKAGAAYLPLDPGYPAGRLEFMLQDAGLELVLVHGATREVLPAFGGEQLPVDDIAETLAALPTTPPEIAVEEGDVAYVIYTSGSTGAPNGAMVSHRAICNRLFWMQDAYQLHPSDRVLQKTPFSFDVSVWEFFWPLMTGAAIVMAIPEGHKDPAYLMQVIEEQQVTTMHFVPSMLQAFLLEHPAGTCKSLKNVFCSGEALSVDLKDRFFQHFDCRLHNLYGPTEAAVDVTYWECRRDDGLGLMPIGYPIHNIQLYIVDEGMIPRPIGSTGELYIGGVGLAEGYLNRTALTAERFVKNPFSPDPKARLYKTGDLARYLPDGAIEFLGRKDFQVKLRGFRIELGEIEAAIRSFPAIRDAVVLARADGPNDLRLVAYLIAEMANAREQAQRISGAFLSEWESVFDQAYTEPAESTEAADLKGWNNSYDGAAIPEIEMQEFVSGAVKRVLATGPRRVLELGVGTGLILFGVGPHVEHYAGADLSQAALNHIASRLKASDSTIPVERVLLLHQSADDTGGLDMGSYDTVVMNSMVQYSPDLAYFKRMLGTAIAAIGEEGRIFLGDLRNLDLQEAFYTSVVCHGLQDLSEGEKVRARVQQMKANENEFLLSPQLFDHLAEEFPAICFVQRELKRGVYHNELTRFRYDVTLYVGAQKSARPVQHLRWAQDQVELTALRVKLSDEKPDHLLVSGVPNARLSEVRRVYTQSLADGGASGQVTEVAAGIDPEAFWAWEASLPYRVRISPDQVTGNPFHFQVEFIHKDLDAQVPIVLPASAQAVLGVADVVNAPLRERVERELSKDLRTHLRGKLPDYMVPAAFVFMQAFPLNANGKLDRKALPSPETVQAPRMKDFVAPRTPVEATLASIWQDVLRLEKVGIHDNFFELSGDSLLSIQITARGREAGLHFNPRQLFQHPTIAELATIVTLDPSSLLTEAPVITGEIPLTPKQRWFFDLGLEEPAYWNSGVWLELTASLEPAHIEAAFKALVGQHDALRCKFYQKESAWHQAIVPAGEAVDRFVLRVESGKADLSAVLEAMHRDFELEHAPLLRVTLFKGDEGGKDRLAVVFHHLVMDMLSWQIMAEDLSRLLGQFRAGEAPSFPNRSFSFGAYAQQLAQALELPEIQADRAYWTDLLAADRKSLRAILGVDATAKEGSTRKRLLQLSKADTHVLVSELPRAYRAKIQDILVSALMRTLYLQAPADNVLLDVLTHGRAWNPGNQDLSQTVGWLALNLPLQLDFRVPLEGEDLIKAVKEGLQTMPHKGMGLELLRSHGPESERRALREMSRAEVCFNYQGILDSFAASESPFQLLYPPSVPERGPANSRPYLLEIEAHVFDAELYLQWHYSPEECSEDFIEQLVGRYAHELHTLIKHCLETQSSGATPSDFPLANLDQGQLDQILGNLLG